MIRIILKNAAIFSITSVLCIALLEIGFRAYSGTPILSLTDWRSQHILAMEAGPFLEYDPLIGWKMTDHYSFQGGGTTELPSVINTIEYGVRKNQASDYQIRQGGILAVGDSFTAGSGVKDSDTWPAKLEQLVGLPVINAAAGAYGIDTNVLRAEQLLPVVRPKILIVGSAGGVYLVSFTSYGWSKPYFTIDDKENITLHNNPVPAPGHNRHKVSVAKRILSYSYVVDFLMTKYSSLFWFSESDQEWTEIPTDKVRLSCALLKRLKTSAEAYGTQMVLMLLQHGADDNVAPETDEQVSFARCAREIGFAVVDEYATIHEMSKDPEVLKTLYFRKPDNTYEHMTPKGNQLIAELIAAELKKHAVDIVSTAEAK